jgi:iron complex transport system substrate-binding protein
MLIDRRAFFGAAIGACIYGRAATAAPAPISVVDMAGRTVTLPARPKRIVLLEARDLLTMSLLHPDPASLVVGWAAVDRIDSDALQKRLANRHELAVVAKQTPDTISLEGLISLAPDLVVSNMFMTPGGDGDPLVQQLGKFGVPVVFSDASSNSASITTATNPTVELPKSMRLWGQLLGQEDKAERFIAVFDRQLADVDLRLKNVTPVTTYLEVQSTLDDCCWAAGNRIWGELLARAGGKPLAGVNAPWFQKLSLEAVLSTRHDVYIATGGGWQSAGRPAIGPGIDAELGQDGLKRIIASRPGFDQLPSVRDHRAHGIWSGLISNPPLNIVFIALAAKWLHPDRFADFDPTTVLDAINKDFAAFPIDGPLWVSV